MPSDAFASDPSFLAPPGQITDWRLVLLFDHVAGAGLGSAAPVVLEALAVFGVVEKAPGGGYRQGPCWPPPERAARARHHARSLRTWARGLPPPDEGSLGVFLDGLAARARRQAPALVDACLAAVPGARSVLDLGGGHGEDALEFARRGLDATLQDRPETIEHVRSSARLAESGVALFPGDFFETLPPGPFDLVLFAGVAHTFDGERNRLLYSRVRPIVAPGGALVVVSYVRNQSPVAPLFAVQMHLVGNGGDTHAESDLRTWLAEAGFDPIERPAVEGMEQSVLVARAPGS